MAIESVAIEWVAVITFCALVLGFGIAWLIFRAGGVAKSRAKQLETELKAAQDELADYKREVFGQFSETAEKFRDLNRSYSALHQQLAASSVALCGDQATPLLGQTATVNANETAVDQAHPEAAGEQHTDTVVEEVVEGVVEESVEEPLDEPVILEPAQREVEPKDTVGAYSADITPGPEDEAVAGSKVDPDPSPEIVVPEQAAVETAAANPDNQDTHVPTLTQEEPADDTKTREARVS